MGLNETVSAERIHIGFFGMRNAGKSSLVNAVTGQDISVVSDIKGTTTDPVKKTMELLPLGPVVIIDTPGLDDEGELGTLRIKKAKKVLNSINIAVLVVDGTVGFSPLDKELINEFKLRNLPYITVFNKSDLLSSTENTNDNEIYVSSINGSGVNELKEKLGKFSKHLQPAKTIVRDIISAGDTVILVTPIDESAPKGRLILPQQMVLRDILDANAIAIVCQVSEFSQVLSNLSANPRMVITDSQVFEKISELTPLEVPLTSFSILMARYKGNLAELIEGFKHLKTLTDGDKVLIAEGCTHHRQCNDIGTVKMPKWIKAFSASEPEFHFSSGGDFPEDLSEYRVIVHCGGCMLNEAEMSNRIKRARSMGIPIVNYGIAIAGMNNILNRSLSVFPDIVAML